MRITGLMLPRILYRLLAIQKLVCMRARARASSLMGAEIGRKCGFGRGVRLDRPWTIFIGQRATLEDRVWIKVEDDHAAVRIGEFSFIGRDTEIDVTTEVTIGSRTLIAPQVFITDHNHNIVRGMRISEQGCSGGAVVIGDDVWIGTHAVILPGVVIGTGAVVAAGAVVNRSIPSYEIWGGVPARRIRERS